MSEGPPAESPAFDSLFSREDRRLCRRLLAGVSRTFSLCIRVLPPSLRDTVTVSYLLCRMADTIEDAAWCDPQVRMDALTTFARLMRDRDAGPLQMAERFPGAFVPGVTDSEGRDAPEASLLRARLAVFRAFRRMPEPDREIAAHWISILALGMSAAVGRERIHAMSREPVTVTVLVGANDPGVEGVPIASAPSPEVPYVLDTMRDLERYSWCVAGTVGLLLTELFLLHVEAPDPEGLRERAVSFGLGLQYTNVLQDLSEDRRRGWSYFPQELARRHGLSIETLQRPEHRKGALRAVAELALEAVAHLDRAFEYSLLLPRRAARVRLFCLWPIFFALRTLSRVWGDDRVVIGGGKVRISRREVRGIVLRTAASCLSDRALRVLYAGERRRFRERTLARSLA